MKKKQLMAGRILSILLVLVMVMSLMPLSALAETVDDTYVPGTYTGEAIGYDSTITVSVTLSNQSGSMAITDISATHNGGETAAYWNMAVSVLDKIKENNGTDNVDTISNATYSSSAIIRATDSALLKAKGVNIFDGGRGTKDDPYLISSPDTLAAFSARVAEGEDYTDTYIFLSADLDLSGRDWTPIGNASNLFAGIFDGNGYTISNLTIGSAENPSDTQYAGLFGNVANTAEFHNVRLTNVQINAAPTASTATYAGALVAAAKNGTSGNAFQNCHAHGKISVNTNGLAPAMVGGLIGFTNQYTTAASCSANVDVSVAAGSKTTSAGGLIGFASIRGLIMNCYATGDVSVDSTSANSNNAGGFIGGGNGMIYNCYASGTAFGSQTSTKVGGFAGSSAAATLIYECYYNLDKVTDGIGNKSGIGDATGKTTAELASEEFVALLSENLSQPKQSLFANAVTEAALSGCDYDARTSAVGNGFYDWKLSDGQAIHSDELWANSVIDTSFFDSGTGTESDPYIIKTETQLRNFATSLTAKLDYSGVYIELGDDIALVEGDWTPIGEGEYAFNGFFDGKDHTISGLKIGTEDALHVDSDAIYYGLFGVLGSGAEIRNLNLDVAFYVTGTRSIYVAGLSGYVSQSLIDNVNVSGTLKGITTHRSANIFVGGIGGSVYKQKIINSSSSTNLRTESVGGIAEAGGICGLQNRGLIANCYTSGSITGTSDRVAEGVPSLGGIAGVHAGTIVNCYSVASMVADCYTGYVGALAGWATGIADTFQSYYNTSATLVTDNLTENRTEVSPAVAIGWSVGPGINDEGEPYTGSISLNVEGLSNDEIISQALADKLNSNFGHLNVDLVNGGRQSGHWTGSESLSGSLKKWTLDTNPAVVLSNETAAATYDTTTSAAIDELLPKTVTTYYEGTFYGRDTDKTTTLKVTIGAGNSITSIEIVSGSGDYATTISDLISGAKSVDDLEDGAFKSAFKVALSKSEIPDYSTYGEATNDLFAQGLGTETDPWIIKTEDQLFAFANFVNEDESYQGKYIELGADITLTKEWTPAGGGNPWHFSGHFDGKGYTIHGIKVGSADNPYSGKYAGLFAYIKGGTVIGLTLSGIDITIGNNGSGRIYAGGIAAAMDQTNASGYIDNVHVNGKISIHSNSGASYAGGLLGQCIRGTITNSSADVDISAVSDAAWVYAGGLIAMPARCGILNSFSEGTINASAPVNKVAIGGLTGFQSGVVYNCYADVNLISSSSSGDIGGLAGRLTGIGLMLDSYYGENATQQVGITIISDKKPVGTMGVLTKTIEKSVVFCYIEIEK